MTSSIDYVKPTIWTAALSGTAKGTEQEHRSEWNEGIREQFYGVIANCLVVIYETDTDVFQTPRIVTQSCWKSRVWF